MDDERALWVVPSRARPTRLRLALDAGMGLDETADYLVCLDEDDPCLDGYAAVEAWCEREQPGRVSWHRGPREPVTARVNQVALSPEAAGHAGVGFAGDDHLAKTPVWSDRLATALQAGAPFAYGDDLHQGEALPTFYLARADVMAALGWLCLPAVDHYWFDNACKDLGAVFVPGVIVEHRHHLWGAAARDRTYADAEPRYAADQAAYEAWRDAPDGRAADLRTVQAALAGWMPIGTDAGGGRVYAARPGTEPPGG